ncbi:MAG: DUF1467 family protein [bacterium]
MNLVGAIIIYLIIWWCVFFMILPQNIKSIWEDPETRTKGAELGAPQDPQIKAKFIRTSWVSAIVWLIVLAIIFSGVISFRDYS